MIWTRSFSQNNPAKNWKSELVLYSFILQNDFYRQTHHTSSWRSWSLSRPIEMCSLVDPHHCCRCQSRDTALAPSSALAPSRRTDSRTSMARHHLSSRRACLSLSCSSTPPRTSSTKTSSAKKSWCGDPSAANAATCESSSPLGGLHEWPSEWTRPTPQGTELVPRHLSPAHTCQILLQKPFSERIYEAKMVRQQRYRFSNESRFARQQTTNHGSFTAENA